jgi:4-amino-4-deoxy-L-arabinose transferase-like glycosyltransferase
MLEFKKGFRWVLNKGLSQGTFTWLWILILCLGFGLRVSSPHVSDFWLDEVHSMDRATLPDWVTYVEVTGSSGHGPLYEWFILHPWISLGTNEFYVRFPTVLLAVLTNAVVFVIGGRLFHRKVALVGGLIFALSSYHLVFSYEARPYVLAALFAALTLLFFVNIFVRPSTRQGSRVKDYAGYVLFAALALYAHYTTAFHLVVLGLLGAGYALVRRDVKLFISWGVAQVVALLTFLPWLGTFSSQFESEPFSWIPPRGFLEMMQFIPQVYWHPKVFDWSVIYALTGSVVLGALILLFGSSKSKVRGAELRRWLVVGVTAWGPVLVGALVSLLSVRRRGCRALCRVASGDPCRAATHLR